jgi:hypothetical protein
LAEPSVNDLAPRTEMHAIETLTLSDQQLLTGDKNGQRLTIAGDTDRSFLQLYWLCESRMETAFLTDG